MMKDMDLILNYLETYEGRDKFLRIFSYIAKFGTLFSQSDVTLTKLNRFSNRMSKCRVILRLFDDIPLLNAAISYGWGKQEPDTVIRCLELIELFVDIIYSPIETICWAGEENLISIDVDKWDKISTYFWIISLSLSLMKSTRKYKKLSKYKNCCLKNLSTCNPNVININNLMFNQKLTCYRMIMDLIFAISYLPNGKLWGGKLLTWHIGLLGTISSLIGLYQALHKRSTKYPNNNE